MPEAVSGSGGLALARATAVAASKSPTTRPFVIATQGRAIKQGRSGQGATQSGR